MIIEKGAHPGILPDDIFWRDGFVEVAVDALTKISDLRIVNRNVIGRLVPMTSVVPISVKSLS